MSLSLAADPPRRDGVPTVDAGSVDAFLASSPDGVAVLLFRGDATRRNEAHDIAVVLPQLVAAFAGRLRPAVVATEDERALMARFSVNATPSLVFVRGDRTLGVIAKIQDWSVYTARIGALLKADADARQGAAS